MCFHHTRHLFLCITPFHLPIPFHIHHTHKPYENEFVLLTNHKVCFDWFVWRDTTVLIFTTIWTHSYSWNQTKNITNNTSKVDADKRNCTLSTIVRYIYIGIYVNAFTQATHLEDESVSNASDGSSTFTIALSFCCNCYLQLLAGN